MSYRAPRWLPGGHLQTIYASLWAPRPIVAYRRERWNTPDGDFVELDWIGDQPGRPLAAMFHGLEGNSQSQYSLALMAALEQRGWNGVVVHFRGCGGEPNIKLRAYHSGDTAEADWILHRLRERHDGAMFATGFSLGGNVLAKWLGEHGEYARRIVAAAAAVSSPLDLGAGGHALGRGFNMIYTRMFLKSLKQKGLAKHAAYPGAFDAAAMLKSRTLYEFDNIVTAPLHGFRDTDDYWSRAAGKPLLRGIRVPTLILNAKNDPFVPAESLPTPADASPSVSLEQPEEGGHCGFVTGAFPGNLQWLPQRLLAFFDQHLQSR